MKEIEAKILEVDRGEVEAKLKSLGAVLEFEKEFVAVYFDTPNGDLKAAGKTIRIRQEGEQAVFTVKKKAEDTSGVKIREEYETAIDSSAQMEHALSVMGYAPTLRMRKTRAQYALDGAHIVIDDYLDDHAYIPVFIEIEAPSIEEVVALAEKLGYPESALNGMNAGLLMEHYAPD